MTAEDETADGKSRARQNVIHEAGLFQGRLGFDKVIILKQDGIEEFSNIAGLQYIPFSKDNIEQSFYELQRKFKKLGLI
jgi:predicted nucleotide-binding protein